MKQTLITLAIAACCAFAAGTASAMTKDEYKAQKDRVSADYKAAMELCKPMTGNASDICKVQAKGGEKVARAELEAQYQPTPSHDEKARLAHADAAYALAKEKCDDQNGNAKAVCRKDAKAAYVSAKADAKVSKAVVENGPMSDKAVSERKEAGQDKTEALYAAAKERCDALSGNAKDACVLDAKKKFGKM